MPRIKNKMMQPSGPPVDLPGSGIVPSQATGGAWEAKTAQSNVAKKPATPTTEEDKTRRPNQPLYLVQGTADTPSCNGAAVTSSRSKQAWRDDDESDHVTQESEPVRKTSSESLNFHDMVRPPIVLGPDERRHSGSKERDERASVQSIEAIRGSVGGRSSTFQSAALADLMVGIKNADDTNPTGSRRQSDDHQPISPTRSTRSSNAKAPKDQKNGSAGTVSTCDTLSDRSTRMQKETSNLKKAKENSSLTCFACCKSHSDGSLTGKAVLNYLEEVGLQLNDPRLKNIALQCSGWDVITEDKATTLLGNSLIRKALNGELAFKNFSNFTESFREIFQQVAPNKGGGVATYIPQLAKQDPNLWAAAVCSVDGQRYGIGDAEYGFCVQSTSKPITYCTALEINGEERVHQHVGREPSGRNFNDRCLMQRKGKNQVPHNPYINAGAIMTASLVKMDANEWDRYKYMMGIWQKLSGGTQPSFQNDTFMGERATASRNFCLAYMMEEEESFPYGTDLRKTLEAYFTWCSIEITSTSMATLAAVLANGGICPMTTERIFTHHTVTNCLSLMMSCGMYDYSGRFAFEIGFPAKSGVSGVLCVVIPGVCGIATFSPRLDSLGNSVRGIDFCTRLSQRFPYHVFSQQHTVTQSAGRCRKYWDLIREKLCPGLHQEMAEGTKRHTTPRLGMAAPEKSVVDDQRLAASLWWSAARGDQQRLRQLAVQGVDVNVIDYDARSALHLAASEGQDALVALLVDLDADIHAKDHRGNTPMMDAVREHRNAAKRTLELALRRASTDIARKAAKDRGTLHRLKGRDLFVYFKGKSIWAKGAEYVPRKTLVEVLDSYGVSTDSDRRFTFLHTIPSTFTREDLESAARREPLLEKTLCGKLVVPNWCLFCEKLEELFSSMTTSVADNKDQAPEQPMQRSRSKESMYGAQDKEPVSEKKEDRSNISGSGLSFQNAKNEDNKSREVLNVMTIDGQRLHLGETDLDLCAGDLMSVAIFAASIELLGLDSVVEYVGTEPSGEKARTPLLNSQSLPYNPFMWNGVLVLCSLLEERLGDVFNIMIDYWSKLCGILDAKECPLEIDEAFLKEDTRRNNYRVNVLVYKSLDLYKFPDAPPKDVMKLFFRLRAIKTSTTNLGSIGAVFANGGVHPITGIPIFQPDTVKCVLSMMYSAGCEAQSGELSFKVGVPAKSSNEGAILVVLPNSMGLCVVSPDVQDNGVSGGALKFCTDFGNEFNCHVLAGTSTSSAKQDPSLYHFQTDMELCHQLLSAAECGDTMTLSQLHQLGFSLDYTDYDYRSAAHVAAANGQVKVLKYLFKKGASMQPRDRWGICPMDDATKKGHHKAAAVLRDMMRDDDGGGMSDCGSCISTISSRQGLNKSTKSERAAVPVAAQMGYSSFTCIEEGEEEEDDDDDDGADDTDAEPSYCGADKDEEGDISGMRCSMSDCGSD